MKEVINILVTRVEQHQINSYHYLYHYCNDLCFKSKNLYNYANYIVRQEFINNNEWIRYNSLDKMLKHEQVYKELPAQTSQQILRLLDKNWKSFFKAIKDWIKNKEKYLGKPKLPKYKKKNGRNVVIFTNQQCKIKDGYIKFPKTDLKLKTKVIEGLQQVRIVPKGSIYVIEVVYKKEIPNMIRESNRVVGIDLGLNNFVTMVNNIGETPIVINGKGVKSINQYYNKQKAYFQSILKKQNGLDWSKRLEKLTLKRNNKIKDFMHKASRHVVDWCVKHNIDTIVIGKNDNWKQEVDLGKRLNQAFVQIPYDMFIHQLQYKAEEQGVRVIVTEESYTSKCSFLDMEEIKKQKQYKGKRIKRGLFQSEKGILINADVNGAYNIIRKVFPKAFADGIEGVGLHPVKLNVA
ncbi:RNA-guided endonuclease InsQ/TnpB family protein [Geobacillus stearothermophilus]|uniref:RNA-guided endonuclease InsQ/TnpB family protein n=5 Tax=Geobacillus stearothermophilus TaxID=1422 RepID=UPI0005195055|nr:RNA-guided endonuclease TnpB family protein [Geobacillus stearothermophilus]MED3749100.1 transposase [Geobacillus stearothermophilus]MED3753677.1 transposase [Geobacillus stearothermophilus]MED4334094.1 transposase [Geobacillus stearothermophilus]MED4357949.1 transposase [Geobacillus stearothermophilus]MED4830973.1 transposase [Geobacillus stearothermophilus]